MIATLIIAAPEQVDPVAVEMFHVPEHVCYNDVVDAYCRWLRADMPEHHIAHAIEADDMEVLVVLADSDLPSLEVPPKYPQILKVVRFIAADNGMRVREYFSWPDEPALLREVEMALHNCTDEDLDQLAAGEQSETESIFMARWGVAIFTIVNTFFNKVFDGKYRNNFYRD